MSYWGDRLPDAPPLSHASRKRPRAGLKYQVIRGEHSGRLIRIEGMAGTADHPEIKGMLCDCWGEVTDVPVRINLSWIAFP